MATGGGVSFSAGGDSTQATYTVTDEDSIPQWAEYLWDELHFRVEVGNRSNVYDIYPDKLDVCKVQFCLTSKKHVGQTIALLDNKMKIGQHRNADVIDIRIEECKKTESIKTLIEDAFKTVIAHIDCKQYSLNEPLVRAFLKQYRDNLPQDVTDNVMLFICRQTDQFYVVGEIDKVSQFIGAHMSYMIKGFVTKKDAQMLLYLKFDQYIKMKHENISVNISIDPPQYQITCTSEYESKSWAEEVKSFLSQTSWKTIKIPHTLMEKLLFDENGVLKDALHAYFKEMIHEQDVCFNLISRGSKNVFVCCRGYISVDVITNTVMENLRCFEDIFVNSTEGWNALKKLMRTEKLIWEKEKKGESVNICCTVHFRRYIVHPRFQFPNHFAIGHWTAEFLEAFGQDIFAKIEVDFSTCLCVSSKDDCVYVCGDGKKTAEVEKRLTSTVKSLRRSIPTAISKNYLQNCKEEIDSSIKSNQCFWKLNSCDWRHRILGNCSIHESWHNPYLERNVYVVQGNVWEVDVDLQIVFTTESLYVLDEGQSGSLGKSACAKFLEYGKGMVETRNTYQIGFTTDVLTDIKNVGFAFNFIIGIVAWSGKVQGKPGSITIDKKELYTALDAVFVKIKKMKIKSIGIPSRFVEKTLDQLLIQQCVDYFMSDKSNIDPDTSLIVCTDKNTSQVIGDVSETLKAHRGLCRKEYMGNQEKLPTDCDHFQVTVKPGFFNEHKADVFVNTTNRNLKLDEGALSKAILEQAGKAMQEQCEKKYPDGISFGDVAVTDSFQLGKTKCCFKRIYHIALKKYDPKSYKEAITKTVVKCLCQAEREKFKKIAFPAFGTGRLGYPRREVAACMVDAINDFCSQCVKPSLKKIKIVVAGDELTSTAFVDEVWRHSKSFRNDTKMLQPVVTKDFRSLDKDLGHLIVRIVTESDYGTPPSHVVKMVFEGTGMVIKRASSKDNLSWNDVIYAGSPTSFFTLKGNLASSWIHKIMNSERITVAAIYTVKGIPVTEEEQVQAIVEVFGTTPPQLMSKLEEIHIVVSNERTVFKAAQLLELDVTQFRRKAAPHSSFEVIGASEEALSKTVAYLTQLEQRIGSQNDTKHVNSVVRPMVLKTATPSQPHTSSATKEPQSPKPNPMPVQDKFSHDIINQKLGNLTESIDQVKTNYVNSGAQKNVASGGIKAPVFSNDANGTANSSEVKTTVVHGGAKTNNVSSNAANTTNIKSAAKTNNVMSAANTTLANSGSNTTVVSSGVKTTNNISAAKTNTVMSAANTTNVMSAAKTTFSSSGAGSAVTNSGAGTTLASGVSQKAKASVGANTTPVNGVPKKENINPEADDKQLDKVIVKQNVSCEAEHKVLMASFEVTAQLNPGLVSSFKTTPQWKVWIQDTENKFHVVIKPTDCTNDCWIACGTLEDILKFENYVNDKMSEPKRQPKQTITWSLKETIV